eukprot:TRINITY_DN6814_c0_g1_i1.p1 TRINITY_DN6814_c0_g1~~TRINITY_DN6814_c0_g1_i1.p1  ORF type:complete len:156 (-),score=9.14 TRINITY_DN6814_c0_g1_i1:241-642(-)
MAGLIVTSLYVGIFGIMLNILSLNVINIRRDKKITMGAGNDKLLERRIRGQANFCEYVPIALILLATLEFEEVVPSIVLHLLGVVLLTGRTIHAVAFSDVSTWVLGRVGGMMLTFTPIFIMAVLCILHGVSIL